MGGSSGKIQVTRERHSARVARRHNHATQAPTWKALSPLAPMGSVNGPQLYRLMYRLLILFCVCTTGFSRLPHCCRAVSGHANPPSLRIPKAIPRALQRRRPTSREMCARTLTVTIWTKHALPSYPQEHRPSPSTGSHGMPGVPCHLWHDAYACCALDLIMRRKAVGQAELLAFGSCGASHQTKSQWKRCACPHQA